MVFHPPAWVPPLPELPDSITIEEFLRNEKYGRCELKSSRNPYTCGLTGKTYTAVQALERVDHLARALGKRLHFEHSDGSEWDRVVCLYSFNTIDYISAAHAIHRLNGIVTPASAAYCASELEHQLRSSGARAIFTCAPLLSTALEATRAVGIADEAVFILPMPGDGDSLPFTTVDQLIAEGETLPALAPLSWVKGQGARQVAYLCYSSGTSGLPKGVKLSHLNMIANILQTTLFDTAARQKLNVTTLVALGLLPLSHIYGLTLVALLSQYRGDEVIILPRFELGSFLAAVERFRIEQLSIVPPILVQMAANRERCDRADLSSVRFVGSGAAPLGGELLGLLAGRYPHMHIVQCYGLTEASPLVLRTSELDAFVGTSGSLLPGTKAKIIDADGKEVKDYETRGELLVQSPSVVLGYLNSEKASAETFVWHDDGRWLKTGDEVLVRKSPNGHEHIAVVDRIKELIKVKGHQVAPAELEAHLLAHHFVSDCAVISVPDERAGELPKAFVVRSQEASDSPDDEIVAAIRKHVEEHKARHKWLNGGIEFIDVIPKSPSGKILRRTLREKERESRREMGAKL